MAANKYAPHLEILPEDDANAELANGFLLHPTIKHTKAFVLPAAGGWQNVLTDFEKNRVPDLIKYPDRRFLMLIDLDDNLGRVSHFQSKIPSKLADRVFVLGCLSTPEKLPSALGNREAIGRSLADDCHNSTTTIWSIPDLEHNIQEAARMAAALRPWFF